MTQKQLKKKILDDWLRVLDSFLRKTKNINKNVLIHITNHLILEKELHYNKKSVASD